MTIAARARGRGAVPDKAPIEHCLELQEIQRRPPWRISPNGDLHENIYRRVAGR